MSPLRRRMIDDMQIRNLTPNTQRVYVAQVVRFACHFRKSPELLGPVEIRTYLIHLTQERRLAASSIIVVVSALRFFFTVTLKRPWIVEDDIPAGRQAKKLPVVLSQEEVSRFLGTIDNLKHRVILTVCYATGLRISEAVRLKPGAIDSPLAPQHRFSMLPGRIGQHEVIQPMVQRLTGDADAGIGHVGEIRQRLLSGDVILTEDHLAIGTVLRTPGAHPALQATTQPIPVMIGMTALHLFEHRDRTQAGMHLEQRADLAVP
jgi:hypothetical protein